MGWGGYINPFLLRWVRLKHDLSELMGLNETAATSSSLLILLPPIQSHQTLLHRLRKHFSLMSLSLLQIWWPSSLLTCLRQNLLTTRSAPLWQSMSPLPQSSPWIRIPHRACKALSHTTSSLLLSLMTMKSSQSDLLSHACEHPAAFVCTQYSTWDTFLTPFCLLNLCFSTRVQVHGLLSGALSTYLCELFLWAPRTV